MSATNMNDVMTPAAPIHTTDPHTPKKEESTKVYTGQPRKLQFSNCDPIPGKLVQPFEPIEWVYPIDGESEFYTPEQMEKDWVPSDIEEDSSSDEECELECEDTDEW